MMERHSHGRFWLAIVVLAAVAVVSSFALAWVSNQLNETQAQLTSLERELATRQIELAGVEVELSTVEGTVEDLEAALANLQVNYARLTEGYGYVLRDPTYMEMQDFLARDRTSEEEYIDSGYTCLDFAANVKANAAKEGIRCAYVGLEYRGGSGHAIVAFDTTDRGLLFVEPQFDWEVDLEEGRRYYQCVITAPGHYMATPDYDDTITRIVVIW